MGTELQREKCSCSQQPSLECRVEEKVFGAYDLGRGEEGTDELSGGGGVATGRILCSQAK